jgi:molecular chaperone GrpE (heat shock protein)
VRKRQPDLLPAIDVLAQVIHHPREDVTAIASQLYAAGRAVTPKQIEDIFNAYGVKKTAARSRWPRSRT